jgi:GDSL-like lipase/acylhydrolase family protein
VSAGWRKLLTISLPAAFAAALVMLCAIELWVRATWDSRKGRPGFFLTDATRGQRLAAGYEGWFAGVPVHVNALELRDPREYELVKRPNTFRILVLGDSITFGHGSIYEHTYPYLTEQRLKAWRPDIEWQVWNAAVPGYNTSQELAQLVEVGNRYKPDLVIVGFFENDLVGNYEVHPPGWLRIAAARVASAARRRFYSFELYKKVVLTLLWRMSGSDAYRLRLEHLGTEEGLLAAGSRAVKSRAEDELTPIERYSDAELAGMACKGGMRSDPALVRAITRSADYQPWIDAVRGFQRLHAEGRYRIMFFVNDVPPVCPDSDMFYDGSKAIDAFFLRVLGAGTPTVSCYDAFLHVRPSQMPNSGAHTTGNSNVVKADVLFGYLRDHVLPPTIGGGGIGN